MNSQKNNVVPLFRPSHKTQDELLKCLYHEQAASLRSFLFSRVNSREETEDIIQEVFSRLAKLDNLHEKLSYGTRSSRAFLFTSANNYLIDLERKKALERNYTAEKSSQQDQLLVEATPDLLAQADQEYSLIKEAIGQLRPVWRKAFVLSRFEHLSYRQIAGQMEISVKTVEKYITSALVEIRNFQTKSRARNRHKLKGKDSE